MSTQAPPAAAALEVAGLSRSYGRLVGLHPFDLTLQAGECVALIGANGSGKTTAVKEITGPLQPTEGNVSVCGFDPHREPEAERARAEPALVPDTPILYDELTVRHHLELVALTHGIADRELDARIELLLERLGLAERAAFLPRELSRGMRQKTQLACALVRPASVLVLDEPIVGLDPPSQTLLHEILNERRRKGAAVLLTTHQIGFADGLADRALMLNDGRVVEQGSWADVSAGIRARGWFS